MATKKSTTKKTTKSAKPSTKRTSAARASRAKSTTRTRTKTTVRKPAKMQSFRVAKQQEPFMSTKPTVQTLYWLVIGVVVVAFSLWILKLQDDISKIYDSIDRANIENSIVEPIDGIHEY